MQQLTPAGNQLVNDLAYRYNLSTDAIIHMIVAVNNGGGSMAQFSCPELGGSGQWMRGGMTMVGDMFNHGLKMTVDNLCSEISNALVNTQVFPIIPPGTKGSNQWWPVGLGQPFSSGAQNSTRYAIFPNRLAIEINGQVTVYDTLDNNIGGISQQQGGNDSLTFSSQYGTIPVSSLPIVSGPGMAPAPQTNFMAPAPQTGFQNSTGQEQKPLAQQPAPQAPMPPTNNAQSNQNSVQNFASSTSGSNAPSANAIIDLIGKLAQLREAGALSDDEFNAKKSELLGRL